MTEHVQAQSQGGHTDAKPARRRHRKPKPSTNGNQLSATATDFIPSSMNVTINGDGTTGIISDTRRNNTRGHRGGRRGRGRGESARSLPLNHSAGVAVEQAHQAETEVDLKKDVIEAETISERLQESLTRGLYECCICCDIIKRHQPVYEDQNCWAVFHLSCITKWAARALKPTEGAPQDNWRCPACNSTNAVMPGQYTCWCTKQIDPEVSKVSPHACGQTCGKSRGGNCPHPCLLPCHPGPCTPCTNLGPQQLCFCGKNSTQRRCVDTDYTLGAWSCQEVCGEVMPCDEHTCSKQCHPGLCGACTELEEATCLCGKESKLIPCANRSEPIAGVDFDDKPIHGSWTCANICERLFDCDIHKCQKSCHSKTDLKAVKCPLSPDFITTCHCGQTAQAELLESPRLQCTDPIPSCGKTCSKLLACGHNCQQTCHDGACPECTIEMDLPCQCGASQVRSTCQDIQLGLQPSCDKVCRAALSCSRHICQNKCCSGHLAAQQRIASRPKGRQAAQFAARHEEIEAEHLCTKPCGRPLACGNHSCGVICHSGPCPTCLIASFDDLSCHCGRTVISAPIACGTSPPACTFPCTRQPACGHPSVPHNCHLDDESCPRCPYLVEKRCMCGKQSVKNQSCWKTNVSCGQVCDRPLACGNHRCSKRCHMPDDCETPCRQTCGKSRSGCGHPCTEVCHEGDCPQDAEHPCQASVMATCACGTLKMAVKCNSQEPDPAQQSNRVLKCTDFCAITERNKKLSAALGVAEDHKPVQANLYEESTLDYYRDNRIWCSTIEQAFRSFLISQEKVKNFKPMKADLREFVHEMADVYGMRSEAMDEEPKRSVQILKTDHTTAPLKSLAQASLSRASSVTSLAGMTGESEKKKGQAYNAAVLVALRFGSTENEVSNWLEETLSTAPTTPLTFEVQITPDAEYAYIRPRDSDLSTEEVEVELYKIRPSLRQAVNKSDMASTAELCWIDRNGAMAYRESRKQLKNVSMARKSNLSVTQNAFDALSME